MSKPMTPGQAILAVISMVLGAAILILFIVLVVALAHNLWVLLVH